MIQTLEAIVNETGKIRLLTEICLEKRCGALVMILNETAIRNASVKENQSVGTASNR
jgi:hypothetical protein